MLSHTALSRLRSLAAGCLVLAIASTAGPAGAAMMSHTYALHGSGQFNKAMASATAAQISKGDFKVSIVASHLPNPSMLHVKPIRHAYIAWIINGMAKHTSTMGMAHLALMYDKKTGNYTANGMVMIDEVTSVIVTAEPSAMTHAPTMPEVTVLSSMGHGQM
ncbi:MAG TPA: hypothetical protein VN837_12400 [Chloroflexota bacterium]|nr:hypothetical protein [Chloroflexota bacterium]